MPATLLGPLAPLKPASRPLLLTRIPAGFPSPADDYVEQLLDLNEYVGLSPDVYLFRCSGDSMVGAGIFPDDVLVVKKGAEARSGDVVIADLDGEYTVKRFVRHGTQMWLVPESDRHAAIQICPGHELLIYGVVTFTIHKHRP
ncbi:LexA family protein [Rubrivirga sp.]|uniref:LexA family protein n=1 Tax=Rubrivirga sp. TaxID=1885344 RepID=UPI003C7521F3